MVGLLGKPSELRIRNLFRKGGVIAIVGFLMILRSEFRKGGGYSVPGILVPNSEFGDEGLGSLGSLGNLSAA